MKHLFRKLLALLIVAALPVASLVAVAEETVAEADPVAIEALGEMEAAVEADAVAPEAAEDSAVEVEALDLWDGEAADIATDIVDNAAAPAGTGLSVDISRVTVPVNGCVKVALRLPEKDDVELDITDGEVTTVHWAFQEPVDRRTELYVYGLKPGKATVTLTNENDERETVSFDVTVKKQKGYKSLTVSAKSVTVRVGDTVNLTGTLTLPVGFMHCKSANKRIATARVGEGVEDNDWPLYITGVKKGTTTVTFSNDQNKEKVRVKVTVKPALKRKYAGLGMVDGTQACRALLVAEEDFKGVLDSARGDCRLMKGMLTAVTGPQGGSWKVTQKKNLTRAGLTNAIYRTFKGADDDDLSLFFIATHGDEVANGKAAGALLMCPDGCEKMKLGELARLLKAVPGKVVVIIEACGSGAGVYKTDNEQNSARLALKNSAEALDKAAVKAFSAADDGLVEGDPVANTGELRVRNKFYVLTSARYHEFSWAKKTAYFVKWLTDGVGRKGAMPADKDGDGVVTLMELYKYISYVGDDTPIRQIEGNYYQHVQVYPKGSAFQLFRRKK